jgi:hypothetical protein
MNKMTKQKHPKDELESNKTEEQSSLDGASQRILKINLMSMSGINQVIIINTMTVPATINNPIEQTSTPIPYRKHKDTFMLSKGCRI